MALGLVSALFRLLVLKLHTYLCHLGPFSFVMPMKYWTLVCRSFDSTRICEHSHSAADFNVASVFISTGYRPLRGGQNFLRRLRHTCEPGFPRPVIYRLAPDALELSVRGRSLSSRLYGYTMWTLSYLENGPTPPSMSFKCIHAHGWLTQLTK